MAKYILPRKPPATHPTKPCVSMARTAYSMEYDVQRYYRDNRFLLYGGGTARNFANHHIPGMRRRLDAGRFLLFLFFDVKEKEAGMIRFNPRSKALRLFENGERFRLVFCRLG